MSRNLFDFVESCRDNFVSIATLDQLLFEDPEMVSKVPLVRADPEKAVGQREWDILGDEVGM